MGAAGPDVCGGIVLSAAGENSWRPALASTRAVTLWPVLEPLLMQRVGFSGEDNLAADAEFNPECRLPLIASANLLVAWRALRKMTD